MRSRFAATDPELGCLKCNVFCPEYVIGGSFIISFDGVDDVKLSCGFSYGHVRDTNIDSAVPLLHLFGCIREQWAAMQPFFVGVV